MKSTTTIPASPSETSVPAGATVRPLFVPQSPRGSEVSAPLIGIIAPMLLSATGMLLLFLGQWRNPAYLVLACVAAAVSLALCLRIAINRARNQPVRPSWVAGVIVLTVYLGPATAVVGFVRLLDQLTGMFARLAPGEVGKVPPPGMNPQVDLLSAVLLAVCATAFIVGCAVFWLEVVALRGRIADIERAVLESARA